MDGRSGAGSGGSRSGSKGGGKESLVEAARTLFAERGVDSVSLREVTRSSGHRNTNAVQYHFADRDGLLAAVLEPFELEAGARRAALLEELEAAGHPPMRAIAGALVRPQAALLETAAGREYLRIVAEMVGDFPRLRRAGGGVESHLDRWSRLASSHMPVETLPLHRRYSAISLCWAELGRRAAGHRRPDHRLFVSDLVDLVSGVLGAAVSEETARLLAERDEGAPEGGSSA